MLILTLKTHQGETMQLSLSAITMLPASLEKINQFSAGVGFFLFYMTHSLKKHFQNVNSCYKPVESSHPVSNFFMLRLELLCKMETF